MPGPLVLGRFTPNGGFVSSYGNQNVGRGGHGGGGHGYVPDYDRHDFDPRDRGFAPHDAYRGYDEPPNPDRDSFQQAIAGVQGMFANEVGRMGGHGGGGHRGGHHGGHHYGGRRGGYGGGYGYPAPVVFVEEYDAGPDPALMALYAEREHMRASAVHGYGSGQGQYTGGSYASGDGRRGSSSSNNMDPRAGGWQPMNVNGFQNPQVGRGPLPWHPALFPSNGPAAVPHENFNPVPLDQSGSYAIDPQTGAFKFFPKFFDRMKQKREEREAQQQQGGSGHDGDYEEHELSPGIALKVKRGLKVAWSNTGTDSTPVWTVTPGMKQTSVNGYGDVEVIYSGAVEVLSAIVRPVGSVTRQQVGVFFLAPLAISAATNPQVQEAIRNAGQQYLPALFPGQQAEDGLVPAARQIVMQQPVTQSIAAKLSGTKARMAAKAAGGRAVAGYDVHPDAYNYQSGGFDSVAALLIDSDGFRRAV